ncbi:MAG: 2-isopropylmalate synthase [Gemmatimonadetes bacterium]|nr:2-isopropylmalate synthase [Gemmatimonadota bacterium]
MDERELIFDWNGAGGTFDWRSARRVELDDETLRDGLQNPSVVDPPIDVKIRLLHLMEGLAIHTADIGLPGAGPRAREAVRALAAEIVNAPLRIRPNCAARTVIADVRPIVEISQAVGVAIEACTFIGSSPIRQYAEDWTLDLMLRATEEAVSFAVREGLPVMYVTEDTTRARPETLKRLYTTAIACGARRICLADTVGHATPDGARALVRFAREEIVAPSGEDVKIDWHGHRDRGLGLANTLAAIEAGADRVHGTALGIGERVGNTEMELLLVNLKLLGGYDIDLTPLAEYCGLVCEACGVSIPHSYPVMGADAFRTGTGVHAAAIIKAQAKGHSWLADRVYSGVPASWIGREQRIEIGPVAGMSNVKYWLREHGYDASDEMLCRRIFDAAKATDHVLTEAEIEAVIREAGAVRTSAAADGGDGGGGG